MLFFLIYWVRGNKTSRGKCGGQITVVYHPWQKSLTHTLTYLVIHLCANKSSRHCTVIVVIVWNMFTVFLRGREQWSLWGDAEIQNKFGLVRVLNEKYTLLSVPLFTLNDVSEHVTLYFLFSLSHTFCSSVDMICIYAESDDVAFKSCSVHRVAVVYWVYYSSCCWFCVRDR